MSLGVNPKPCMQRLNPECKQKLHANGPLNYILCYLRRRVSEKKCAWLLTLLDQVEGVHRLTLLHDDMAFGDVAGAQKDCQADELLPGEPRKGLHALQHAQQPLQLLHLQASHL